MFSPGHSFDDPRILSKQVISVLLWKCNLNWSHPCNIDDPFSGNIVFISFTINNWIPFTILSCKYNLDFLLRFIGLTNKYLICVN